MKRFNSSKVAALGNLQPKSEKQKAYSRRLNGIKVRFSLDTEKPAIKKTREFLSVVRSDFVPAKPRGRSGTRMSPAKRAMVQDRGARRAAFFASPSEG